MRDSEGLMLGNDHGDAVGLYMGTSDRAIVGMHEVCGWSIWVSQTEKQWDYS